MRLRHRRTGEIVEATVSRQNMGVDDGDFWAWVLEVPTLGVPWPIKPGVAGCDYEIVDVSDEERERLRAGNYLDRDDSLVCFGRGDGS